MRKIKITKELSIKIAPLKRRQIKALRKKGYKVSSVSCDGVPASQWDDFFDALIQEAASDRAEEVIEALDSLGVDEYRKVCLSLIAETWGSKEEEKN